MVTLLDILINVSFACISASFIIEKMLLGSKFGAVLDMVTDRYSIFITRQYQAIDLYLIDAQLLVFYVSFLFNILNGLFSFKLLFLLISLHIICTCIGKISDAPTVYITIKLTNLE